MKKNFSGSGFTLGILGGGQLGRMLLQKTVDLNISTSVMDPDPNAPCRNLCDHFVNAPFNDFDAVYRFGKTVSLLTVEIEHVNTEALKKLEEEGLPVYPQPAILSMVQDKGLQKEFYRKHNIPTASFSLINTKNELSAYHDKFPFILKKRTGGYDGKGVIKISRAEDIETAFDGPYVLEDCIPFTKEIAVIVSRNADGVTSAFPACEMVFNSEANLVEYLFAPAAISDEQLKKAGQIAENLISLLELTGILAVEMFLTAEGDLLVNEIAPRPHNSGHHTIEANHTSQYEQHLRAILNLPPGNTSVVLPAVMVNLLGEKGFSGEAYYEGLEEVLKEKGTHVHLYGKKETRPFRKMGHVTITGATVEEAIQTAERVRNTLKVKTAG
jgi:5-(carboxyamino)imidazole ribonucleotide synthase